MKLEEAIKHLEEMLGDNSKECNQEHKKLLGFLKELQRHRKNDVETDKNIIKLNIEDVLVKTKTSNRFVPLQELRFGVYEL